MVTFYFSIPLLRSQIYSRLMKCHFFAWWLESSDGYRFTGSSAVAKKTCPDLPRPIVMKYWFLRKL